MSQQFRKFSILISFKNGTRGRRMRANFGLKEESRKEGKKTKRLRDASNEAFERCLIRSVSR